MEESIFPKIEPQTLPSSPSVSVAASPSSSPPPRVVPGPKPRQFIPDLTGFWEARGSGPNVHPRIQLQINQAGSGLAIWFTRPPTGLEGVDPLNLPDDSSRREWTFGVAPGYGWLREVSNDPIEIQLCFDNDCRKPPWLRRVRPGARWTRRLINRLPWRG